MTAYKNMIAHDKIVAFLAAVASIVLLLAGCGDGVRKENVLTDKEQARVLNDSAMALFDRVVMSDLDSTRQVLALLDRSIGLDSTYRTPRANKAVVLIHAGRLAEARETLRGWLSDHEEDTQIRTLLGIAHDMAGEDSLASQEYSRVTSAYAQQLNDARDSTDLVFEMAFVMSLDGKRQEAASLLDSLAVSQADSATVNLIKKVVLESDKNDLFSLLLYD